MKTTVLQDYLGEALRSALEVSVNPAMASADWLARDIDPDRPSAVALLTDPDVPLDDIQKAKSTYKTMRIVGETGADTPVSSITGGVSAANPTVPCVGGCSRFSKTA
jgi:hypothetical protein